MEQWDANEFASKMSAGVFDGELYKELEKLSQEQLIELVQVLQAEKTKTGD